MWDPKNNPGYVDQAYLDTVAEELAATKQRSYELMQVQSGQRVLDVGCGAGFDTIPLAMIVGSGGSVVGVDCDDEMIADANKRAAEAGVTEWIKHEQADAAALPYDDNTFDSCRSERVFQYLPDSDAALAEMVRVTKPGGWVVVLDTDWYNISLDTQETEIEWKLRQFRTVQLNYGFSGRRLYRQFRQNNLEEISIEVGDWHTKNYALADVVANVGSRAHEAHEAGFLTAEELDRWLANLKRADEEGRFLYYMIGIFVAGRKPSG